MIRARDTLEHDGHRYDVLGMGTDRDIDTQGAERLRFAVAGVDHDIWVRDCLDVLPPPRPGTRVYRHSTALLEIDLLTGASMAWLDIAEATAAPPGRPPAQGPETVPPIFGRAGPAATVMAPAQAHSPSTMRARHERMRAAAKAVRSRAAAAARQAARPAARQEAISS